MAEARSGATPLEGNGKRVLLIDAAPQACDLCHALSDAYTQGARRQNHVVRSLKLGALAFDPLLHGGHEQSPPSEPDLIDAQRQIHWAEHLVFVYPVRWGGLPALLSGFFERVFTPGFAFRTQGRDDPNNPLLSGRSAELLVTLDTPVPLLRSLFGTPAHRQVMRAVLGGSGICTTRLTRFSPVRGASEAQRQAWVRQAEQLGAR